ncbi:hypothetical protein EVAR_2707_1 [Eumeta japonica]|uniref:Uncharacterized protein n=1 Tax=Eumeta variegata TaxID=151549 RepID=A0A4C1SPZ8_EUMVA|nr:hypothetical protein EVAR_2707_1 [Eumeta japonica]
MARVHLGRPRPLTSAVAGLTECRPLLLLGGRLELVSLNTTRPKHPRRFSLPLALHALIDIALTELEKSSFRGIASIIPVSPMEKCARQFYHTARCNHGC